MTITTILSPLDHGQAMESLSGQVDWRVAAACLSQGSGTVIANRGDIYNCFHVAKHRGQWHIEESRIEDLRAIEDRAEFFVVVSPASNQSMKPTQPLVLRLQRNRSFCFKWLGGLPLPR